MGVDRQLTFEILLYLNIFYTGLYTGMEALFLVLKWFYVEGLGGWGPGGLHLACDVTLGCDENIGCDDIWPVMTSGL